MVDIEKGVYQYLSWDPNSQDIVISTDTDSIEGSEEAVTVVFYDDNNEEAGTVYIRFTSPIKYKIGCCTSWTTFPGTPPTDTDKTWRIGYNHTEKSLLLHCNEVEVLNMVISDSACPSNRWVTYWEMYPTQIMFYPSYDTASEQYCLAGKLLVGMFSGSQP